VAANAGFGYLEVRADGSYTWDRNGRVRRGQLEPFLPRRGAQAGVDYYRMTDGLEDFYLFFAQARGERYMQVHNAATDQVAAYGYRDPGSR
jgi:hypothetical protein